VSFFGEEGELTHRLCGSFALAERARFNARRRAGVTANRDFEIAARGTACASYGGLSGCFLWSLSLFALAATRNASFGAARRACAACAFAFLWTRRRRVSILAPLIGGWRVERCSLLTSCPFSTLYGSLARPALPRRQ